MNNSGSVRMAVAVGLLWSVTAVAGCEWGSVPIEATVSEYSISVSPDSGMVAVGSTIQLTATVVDANGDTLVVQVEWASRNPAVATVDSGGIVAGVSEGHAEIVATYSGSSAKADVQVQ